MSFARSARTHVLPTPHIPNGLTIAPATEVRQGCRGIEAIMPDKGKVERPFRYIRQDFFLGRRFRNLDDLNVSCGTGCTRVANPRHARHHLARRQRGLRRGTTSAQTVGA